MTNVIFNSGFIGFLIWGLLFAVSTAALAIAIRCVWVLRAPLKISFRRLFASGQSPTGKIFCGYVQVATLKSSCIGLLVHTLKIHPIEF